MKAFGDEDTIFEDMDVLNPNEQTYQPGSLPEREVELDQSHSRFVRRRWVRRHSI